MRQGALGSNPPPFFRQGPSAFSRLLVFSAVAVLLMVADARFKMMQPLRVVLSAALYPVQWLAMRPVQWVRDASQYAVSTATLQAELGTLKKSHSEQSLRANQVEQLALENARLRKLLGLRVRFDASAMAAQVMYDAADSFVRKVIIDKGLSDKVQLGSPVVDETGIIGQVTRVYPFTSEVTLITNPDHPVPVLNIRTGGRGVVYGDGSSSSDAMELRFVAANADIVEGDLLATSGVDGLYPPGLPVARVVRVERSADTMFARIYCTPVALVSGSYHVLVLEPFQAAGFPTAVAEAPPSVPPRRPVPASAPASAPMLPLTPPL